MRSGKFAEHAASKPPDMSVGFAFALCSFGMSAFSFFSNSRKDFTQVETCSSLANTQAFSPCKDADLSAIKVQATLTIRQGCSPQIQLTCAACLRSLQPSTLSAQHYSFTTAVIVPSCR